MTVAMNAPTLDEQDLITIEFRGDGTEGDLQPYLEKRLGVRLLIECVESADWPLTTLFVKTTAVPLGIYAGKKLIDVLTDMIRAWLQQKSRVTEIVLYEPDGTKRTVKK
jgi:hypothetical protein